ncbi:MAG: Arylsulfatase [Promethearchaeota archaeon]|nr:MAG: Arylsulfatase [Candidatus Lokiarchaeota archaeon]
MIKSLKQNTLNIIMKNKRPNIILILADDMGFSDIGCYGGEIKTPNLDKLAEGGVRFTQFFNTARCSPSRASLLTGLHPHQAGIGILVEDYSPEGYAGDLNDKCITIAELLKSNGYKTYMSGKWHISTSKFEVSKSWPNQRGFDHFYGTIVGAGSYYYPLSLTRNNENIEQECLNDDFYYTDAITNNAMKYINMHHKKNPNKPFFLYVSYTAPHWPLHAKPEIIEKYRGYFKEGWDILRKKRLKRQRDMKLLKKDWRLSERDPRATPWKDVKHKEWQQRRMEVYAAQIDIMDEGVGKIVDTLKKCQLFKDTLIIFLSDNGGCAEPLGKVMEKVALADASTRKYTRSGERVKFGNKYTIIPGGEETYQSYGAAWANLSNTPFRKFKKWTHEGGIATPLIIHWPNEIKLKGEIRHQQGQLTDIMATIVDITGIKYPDNFKGRIITPLEGDSLVPIFENRNNNKGMLFFEHEGNAAIRDGKWKLVRDYPGEWELYDMEEDRTELNNLIKQHHETALKMEKAYEKWAKRCGVIPREKILELQKQRFREKYK